MSIVDGSPPPRNLIKTLMKVGYTLNTSVSDILDNSISADSSNIWINIPFDTEEPMISITDDGFGMDKQELIDNMKIGCKDPDEERRKGDLGRFGSGMKTASFSQARKLTVISKKKNSSTYAAIWDVDRIVERNSWELEVLSGEQLKTINSLKISSSSGTQVIWEQMPKYRNDSHQDIQKDLARDIVEIKKHLAICFHRFIKPEDSKIKKINIFVNKDKLQAVDPFMRNHKGYQEGFSQTNKTRSGKIFIKVHVVPHESMLRQEDKDALGVSNAREYNNKQGFYIYRDRRLIIQGGWMGQARTSNLGNLARIQIDMPSTMDHEWVTDVKKSSLQLPMKALTLLKRMTVEPRKSSRKEYKQRAKKEEANPFWKIVKNQHEKTIKYQIDTSNRLIRDLVKFLGKKHLKKLIDYLKQLSLNLPTQHILVTMSETPDEIKQDEIDWEAIQKELELD